ncbi:formate dehydrogenase accessory sulfurtransferase FdhD [Arthrobacter sp. zg-Y20]|uniref:formate dehydrogenase accessory sulfurtransferase FdhD n=1 Tax=unclassified Arthrobacter TaxID=235627 RepID=UPI001D14F97F|nr:MULTISPECIES: formate dehydrogenase accessory sulfurtransferase FdhD [unclassified Arthrobacter]MCC3276660.1 formate dehydrogenase accessory sulfurtransferase FdhD [Arthrobacter sp. zg-Y20]MDK1316819.1 formate dehydrogenase accessory sulfurtransferase FdhD [Arthrobacter sp. zg.Y20]WIB06766.1 formate dehydrogenase accessory sulfurtransferase FdhD [Arthrobacter sp. zg-Y20]
MGRVTTRGRVTKFRLDGNVSRRDDVLAGEEPLEIRVGGKSFTVTMRTPGDDFDLVAGFLVSEGVIWEPGQLISLRYCAGVDEDGKQTFNVVDVQLRPGTPLPDTGMERHVYTSSSCGICGTASIEAVRKSSHFDLEGDGVRLPLEMLASLPDRLREGQKVFDRTGGVHAAGLFSAEGELLCLREDVGRHNAVDKVVGWALRAGLLPLRGMVLQVSGRASFELVQKAQLAGIPVLAAVSAPSALSVELAQDAGLTLIGFSRGISLNCYSAPERILAPVTAVSA